MKKLLTLLLTILLLAGCSGGSGPDRKTYEKYDFISINMNSTDESKEFWFAIDDQGNVIDGASAGWDPLFAEETYSGNYKAVFDRMYDKFDGERYEHIGFGFANMSEETEKKYRKECEEYIGGLRPDLDFETGTEDFGRVYEIFESYYSNKTKNQSRQSEGNDGQEDHPAEDEFEFETLKAGNEKEFKDALGKCREIVLTADIEVDLSDTRSEDSIIRHIDCAGHSLTLYGDYEISDKYGTIEIDNAENIDISRLILHPDGLTPSDEKLETNKMKLEGIFIMNISYRNVKLDDALLRENAERHFSKIEHEPYIYINDEGNRVEYIVRRALSYDVRHEMEMEQLEAYLADPEHYPYDRPEIYTDIELYLDDYNTPSDFEVSFDVKYTGTLKLSGRINICGPKALIGSKRKGSVDLTELEVVRKCMSPDCIWVDCEEGIDEEKLTPVISKGVKFVPGISETRYAVTIWSKGE